MANSSLSNNLGGGYSISTNSNPVDLRTLQIFQLYSFV